MVLTKQAEWASVDSTTLLYSKKYMQDGGKDIEILKSIGPLPPYPVVVNSRLPEELKKTLTRVFLSFPHDADGEWKRKFIKYGLVKFLPNDSSVYDKRDSKSENGTKSIQSQYSVPYY
jgi:ABC-type phosphate/phosphonate transport system substrate-binding protein